ncbi:Arv1-domain-containing protein [Coprinellus micaceus]|uniref:Protein ARV n=1 Tax=Coprinellus micaceus TaxID=71717 RepID=A0A4Y7SYZ4_COPMI|nr:Arv1-domain-containing protein [Coprinellus micaceus]
MPICTSCTHATEFLYTTYESECNLRLEQCRNCKAFVDPYVEFDVLTLFIDLILLKRGVYRHLLYNRGTPPRRVVGQTKDEGSENEREIRRWEILNKMGPGLVFLDAFIRWTYLNPTPPGDPRIWNADMLKPFTLVLSATVAETLAFHLGVTFACYCVLKLVDIFRTWRTPNRPVSAVRQQFRLSLVPLTMFYSSLTKYFLLLLLTVWMPVSRSGTAPPSDPLPAWAISILPDNHFAHGVIKMLDDDRLDREWVVRNVLGGMSAGFGLRVILDDVQPFFTTLIIVFGWAAKTFVAQVVSGWIGVDEALKQAWLAYSIP